MLITKLRAKVKELKTMEKNSSTEKKMLENQAAMMNNSKNRGGVEGSAGSQLGDTQNQQIVSPERMQQERERTQKMQYINQLNKQLQAVKQEHDYLTQELVGGQMMQQM